MASPAASPTGTPLPRTPQICCVTTAATYAAEPAAQFVSATRPLLPRTHCGNEKMTRLMFAQTDARTATATARNTSSVDCIGTFITSQWNAAEKRTTTRSITEIAANIIRNSDVGS